MIKQNRAITLIALIITIIVLLILAGVSLYMVLGDNGLIAQAQRAKAEAEAKDEWEQVEIAVVSARNASLNGADFYSELKKNIKREFNSDNVSQGEDNIYTIILNNGNRYRIEGEEITKVDSEDPDDQIHRSKLLK